jgi:hypothetical protein
MLRGVALFLIGAGIAAAIFVTGVAERTEQAFGGSGFWHQPLVLRVGSSLHCSPQYAVLNRSNRAVYFALPGVAREDVVKIPPGASLAPSGFVGPLTPVGLAVPADDSFSMGSGAGCPAIHIELAQG